MSRKKLQNDYLFMVNLGDWLERFFDEGINGWQLRELANDAIKLLSIDYVLKNNEPFLTIVDLWDSERKIDDQFFIQPQIVDFVDKVKINFAGKVNFEWWDKYDDDDDKPVVTDLTMSRIKQFDDVIQGFGSLAQVRLNAMMALRDIFNNTNVPWDKSDVVQGRILIRDEKTPSLFLEYPKITERLKITSEGVKKMKSFQGIFFLWNAALSHIFFDFLFLGGQDYFGFCDQCGKFFFAQRKGRKKFCSDRCRLASYIATKS